MPIDVINEHQGIAEVVIDHPPVNALDVAGWFELADAVIAAGRSPTTGSWSCGPTGRASTPASTSRRSTPRARGPHRRQPGLLRRLRRRVRLRGAADRRGQRVLPRRRHRPGRQRRHRRRLEDATFGLPEVDRGALGAATHLARLVPQHAMRAMVYTATPGHRRRAGFVRLGAAVVPPDRLRAAALAVAADIAAKSPTVIRRAKEWLNGIDLDVKRSYRFEQGFTFELNCAASPTSARRVRREDTTPTPTRSCRVGEADVDKRMSRRTWSRSSLPA